VGQMVEWATRPGDDAGLGKGVCGAAPDFRMMGCTVEVGCCAAATRAGLQLILAKKMKRRGMTWKRFF
jgi:hypothetical protein